MFLPQKLIARLAFWRFAGIDGEIQRRQTNILLHPVDAVRRRRRESDRSGHGDILRQRLESHDGRPGAGQVSQNRSNARRTHLQVSTRELISM